MGDIAELRDAYDNAVAQAQEAEAALRAEQSRNETLEQRLASVEDRLNVPREFGAPIPGGVPPDEITVPGSVGEIRKLYQRDKQAALDWIDKLGDRVNDIPEVAVMNAVAFRDPKLTPPPRFIHPVEEI